MKLHNINSDDDGKCFVPGYKTNYAIDILKMKKKQVEFVLCSPAKGCFLAFNLFACSYLLIQNFLFYINLSMYVI